MNSAIADPDRHVELIYGARLNAPLLQRGNESVINFFHAGASPNPSNIHNASADR